MPNNLPNAQQPEPAPPAPISQPPESVRQWRRLMRLRNGIVTAWLVGTATELLVVLPLLFRAESRTSPMLGAMLTLTLTWIAGCSAGLILHSHQEQHICRTFPHKDLTSLGCWIDTLVAPTALAFFPLAVNSCCAPPNTRPAELLRAKSQE